MRPRVICHMMTSVDGRIVTGGWPLTAEARRQYELVHAGYEADGWLCGRVTMEPFAGALRSEAEVARQREGDAHRDDFVAPGEHESYAFAVDASGRLAWATNDIFGDHVVAILSSRVSDAYLEFLRERGVSYMLCGAPEVDLGTALDRIGARFGIRTLMLEGGGRINGALLRDGLIDELSLLVVPVADGRMGTPALFDLAGGEVAPARLSLQHMEQRADGAVWLRYRVDRETT